MRSNRKAGPKFTIASSLLAAVALAGCGGGSPSNQITNPPASLTLSVSPTNIQIAPNTSFFVTIGAAESGTSATPTISLGTLPAGISTSSIFPMSAPSNGAIVFLTASSSVAQGNLTIPVSGSAGGASASASIALTVTSNSPGPAYWSNPLCEEERVAQGGSESFSGVLQEDLGPVYDVSLSVTGLPPGVTATVNPQVAEAGSSFTVTLTASANAPPAQNALFNVIGTPSANTGTTQSNCLLEVTPAGGGAGWNNQTSYVFTRAAPISAVYDPVHQLIYAANQVWNRIDVISDQTRSIVKSISIQDPRGMDLSVDGNTVWVTTGYQMMYGINTSTLQSMRYLLPRYGPSPGNSWEGAQAFSLADGTVLIVFSNYTASGSEYGAIWNPATNAFTQPASPAEWGAVARSGDGKHIFSFGADELETSFTYDVLAQTFSKAITLSGFGYAGQAAANLDGSRAAVASFGAGFSLYDGNLNLIGPLPGDGAGFVFSPDGQTIYEETSAVASIPVIDKISVSTQQSVSMATSMLEEGWFSGLSIPWPFALDSTGMLLGIQNDGIAFDDSNPNFQSSSYQPGPLTYMGHMQPIVGPLTGGTVSGGFGNGVFTTPDVYYGAAKATVSVGGGNLSITSPPATAAGPVDVKMLFPDGEEVYNPLFFTYGVQAKDVIVTGGSPQGGALSQLDAFGLPLDPTQDTVTIGGSNAAVTSVATQYPPFSGQLTALFLSFNTPSGMPGWADLKVTTPNGSSTLPKSFFFAKSVNDYSTSDDPTFVLYDKGRNQLYLSAGNHIDVFSLSSNSFTTPLQPPAAGANKQFEGLALTPDGKNLLAADLTDNSLAVIDPDNPSTAFAVPVATGGFSPGYTCPTGPLFAAADNLGNAYVVTGGVIGTACGPGGYEAIVNLASKSSTLMQYTSGCAVLGQAGYVEATAGGTLVAFGGSSEWGSFQLYVPAKGFCIPVADPAEQYGITAAADGNVIGLLRAFVNSSGDIVGRFAYPTIFYPNAGEAAYYNYSPYQDGALQNPTLNDVGSLFFWAYPNYIDIVDAQHGAIALRFGLTETIANTVSPMAIDSGGQHIFLITNKGLSVVDLGDAPLSIGHFSQTAASPGNQIEVRGSGFENGIAATLGGISTSVTFTDSETVTLTVPSASAGPQDLILSNPDGTSYTLQSAITVQ